MNMETGFPCGYCGVRSDVSCKHRPGEPKRAVFADRIDRRTLRDFSGMGHNFHRPASPKKPSPVTDAMEQAWLRATPAEGEPLPSGKIVRLAGCGSAAMFGHFAKRRMELFERHRDGHNSFAYRLTPEGIEARSA